MRLYTIDDLTAENIKALTARLDELELQGSMDGIYWLPLPSDMLNDVQTDHASECGPHCMALEISGSTMQIEFLVRARNKLRCDCVSYASPALRLHIIEYVDNMLEELGIYV